MLEEDELAESTDLSNRSVSSLLKIISKKIKKDPGITEEAAQLNLHILTLKYIAKTLPTADHIVRYLYFSLLFGIRIIMQEELTDNHPVSFLFYFLLRSALLCHLVFYLQCIILFY